MSLETRVGHMAVSVLKEECKEAIKFYYEKEDYENLLNYIEVYREYEKYSGEIKND